MMSNIEFTRFRQALLTFGLIAAASGTASAHQSADKNLQDSEKMIASCVQYAASQKYPPVSIGVIDLSGTLVAFKRQDGASAATADAALLKARTALRVNAATADLTQPVEADAATRDAFLLMQLTTLPGGVPVVDDHGHLVGAVGVSGGAAEQDAECARRAIEVPATKRN